MGRKIDCRLTINDQRLQIGKEQGDRKIRKGILHQDLKLLKDLKFLNGAWGEETGK